LQFLFKAVDKRRTKLSAWADSWSGLRRRRIAWPGHQAVPQSRRRPDAARPRAGSVFGSRSHRGRWLWYKRGRRAVFYTRREPGGTALQWPRVMSSRVAEGEERNGTVRGGETSLDGLRRAGRAVHPANRRSTRSRGFCRNSLHFFVQHSSHV